MSAAYFTKLAVPGVQGLQPYQPGMPIEALEREYGITDVIKLASNECSLGPSERVAAKLSAAFIELSRYPDGNGFQLKCALEQHLAIDRNKFTLGNGSNDVLELIARAFVLPIHDVIYSQYAFAVYPIVTQAIGAIAVVIPAQAWGHDLEQMLARITPQTRLIFIANPNNPTGTWLSRSSIESFLAEIPGHVIVVVDEAYFEYVDKLGYATCLGLLDKFSNLIVTRTFSKAYGLASLRVGYSVSHPEIANLLNRVRQPFNVNHFALVAATLALEDSTHLEKVVELNQLGMDYLTAAMRQLGLAYIPSAGNFLSIDVGQAVEPVFQRLLKQGVIVRPVANYQMPTHIRVTIGTSDQNQRFVTALTHSLTGVD